MQPSIVSEAIAFRLPPIRDFLNLMSEIFMLILPVFLKIFWSYKTFNNTPVGAPRRQTFS